MGVGISRMLAWYNSGMNDLNSFHIAPARRSAPPFEPAEDTAQQSPVQEVAEPVQDDAVPLQVHEASIPVTKDYTISVDDIRIKLHDIGISKSKDTIQRYCREESLDCKKLGMFKRYFATEKSVEKLIEKIQSDATASNSTQVHAGADVELEKKLQVHEDATERDVPENNASHAGASNSMQVHEDARTTMNEEAPEANSYAGKIVEMLEKQIDDKDKTISFLQEELVARRGAVSALEKIIDAFGDNAQASLLSAENEKQRMDQSRDNQQGSEPAEVVHDIHSDQKEDNYAPDYRV